MWLCYSHLQALLCLLAPSLKSILSLQKKISTRLESSEIVASEVEVEAGVDESDRRFAAATKKKPEAKEIRSLTGEVIDKKRMAELRKIK